MIHKHSRIPGDDAGELELRHPTVHKEVHVRFREEIGDDTEVRFVLGGVEGHVVDRGHRDVELPDRVVGDLRVLEVLSNLLKVDAKLVERVPFCLGLVHDNLGPELPLQRISFFAELLLLRSRLISATHWHRGYRRGGGSASLGGNLLGGSAILGGTLLPLCLARNPKQ